MKKAFIISILLMFLRSAYAITFIVEGIEYSKTSETMVTVVKSTEPYSGEMILPSSVTYDNVLYSVTSIDKEAFSYCNDLSSIAIPSSVTSIGERAFSFCSNLTSVTMSSSVASIGNGAFFFCRGLTEITIPSSVISIGNQAFFNCNGLAYITIPSSVKTIGDQVFADCAGLKGITIPSSVTRIGDRVFTGCKKLENIETDPANPNYVSVSGVLYNKQKTVLIAFPAGKSGKYVIPSTVKTISTGAFYSCTELTAITIPSSVTTIDNSAFFRCSKLTEISIPSSVTIIGSWAFYSCSGLKSLIIPSSITSISNGAFFGCSGLKDVTIPSSVTSIGERAFFKCDGLKNIIIPSSVTSIGNEAFTSCANLKSFHLDEDNPNFSCVSGVLYNKDQTTLIMCPGRKSGKFIVPTSVVTIGDMAFASSALKKVIIPFSVETIGSMALANCERLKSIEVDESNIFYSSLSGVLYNRHQTELIACPAGIAGEFIIPPTVTSISNRAFSHCHKLKDITIPSSVSSIGDWAFIHCQDLKKIIIPSSVNSIGEGAFSYCINLTNIYACSKKPIDLSLFIYFYNIDKNNCKLYVPTGSKKLYETANDWKKFTNIIEFDVADIVEIQ